MFRSPASICFIEANDVFVAASGAGKFDAAVLNSDWISPAKSALGASSTAPAETPAMVNLRREILIDPVCVMAILSLMLREPIAGEMCR
jgi:hypothetical protein